MDNENIESFALYRLEKAKETLKSVYYNDTASFADEKGIFRITDYDLVAGNYTVNVIYKGNDNFTGSSAKFNFTVSKARTSVTAKANNTTFNQSVIVEYHLANINNTNAVIPNGTVTINITNKENGKKVYYTSSAPFTNENDKYTSFP